MERDDVEQAFAWDDPYDIVLALVHLTDERMARQNLSWAELSIGERVVIHVNWFDNEVANGGFHQFFTNASGNEENWTAILNSLQQIKAVHTVALIEEAVAAFPEDFRPKNSEKTWDYLLSQGAEVIEILEAVSARYFQQAEQVYALAAKFLLSRKQDFLRVDPDAH
ncbi:MAG: DUF4375 domain-containing protein [Anaerolineales bacterium]|nr:DUF4375 domain-containing protein [Anaerolineales bacterium]